jgi:hypothetical protein
VAVESKHAFDEAYPVCPFRLQRLRPAYGVVTYNPGYGRGEADGHHGRPYTYLDYVIHQPGYRLRNAKRCRAESLRPDSKTVRLCHAVDLYFEEAFVSYASSHRKGGCVSVRPGIGRL